MAIKEQLVDWLDGTDKNKDDTFSFGYYKWIEYYNNIHELKEKYPNNVIIIFYENLINDTEDELHKICDFCNISYHNNISDCIFKLGQENHDYDYSVYKNKNTIDKWRTTLKPTIVKFIYENLQNTNNYYKYINI